MVIARESVVVTGPAEADNPLVTSEDSPIRVLVVDDDAMSREVLRDQLEQAGYDVFIHASAEKLTGALIRAMRPALVLCGLDLPGVAPERFAPLVQNLRGALGVRTILISNLAPHLIAERAKVVGADGWFEKSRLFFDARGAVEEALARQQDPTRQVAIADTLAQRPAGGLAEAPPAAAAAALELVGKIGSELAGFHERNEPRADVDLPCSGRSGNEPWEGRIRDISASGLFVATTAPLAVGARCSVDMKLPDGTELRAETTVVWHRGASKGSAAGVGLKFGFLLPEDREAIEGVVRTAVPELFD